MADKLSTADVAAVKEVVEASLRFVENGDMDKWVQCWTEDAMVMAPGMPAFKELARLETFIRDNWVGRRTALSDVRIDGRDDLAVLISRITFFGVGPGGKDLEGKHIIKLLKQPDGKWLIAVITFNFDVPDAS